ncbi:MAG: hypothetical protein PF482_18870 [Desulfobacteraceae bacterium]|jgi:hypothetical protein|nr:hypothetical protein [Desulfobacteraceae bacterium]
MTTGMNSVQVFEPEILRSIDLFLEDFYDQAIKTGKKMAESGLKKTQLRGLETIITSASRFSEIINYIKSQAGKDTKGQWPETARLMLEQLDLIEKKAIEIGDNNTAKTFEIKLKMARGWAKQVVANYLYSMLETERN